MVDEYPDDSYITPSDSNLIKKLIEKQINHKHFILIFRGLGYRDVDLEVYSICKEIIITLSNKGVDQEVQR